MCNENERALAGASETQFPVFFCRAEITENKITKPFCKSSTDEFRGLAKTEGPQCYVIMSLPECNRTESAPSQSCARVKTSLISA